MTQILAWTTDHVALLLFAWPTSLSVLLSRHQFPLEPYELKSPADIAMWVIATIRTMSDAVLRAVPISTIVAVDV
jgi:hypothetical protein